MLCMHSSLEGMAGKKLNVIIFYINVIYAQMQPGYISYKLSVCVFPISHFLFGAWVLLVEIALVLSSLQVAFVTLNCSLDHMERLKHDKIRYAINWFK